MIKSILFVFFLLVKSENIHANGFTSFDAENSVYIIALIGALIILLILLSIKRRLELKDD